MPSGAPSGQLAAQLLALHLGILVLVRLGTPASELRAITDPAITSILGVGDEQERVA